MRGGVQREMRTDGKAELLMREFYGVWKRFGIGDMAACDLFHRRMRVVHDGLNILAGEMLRQRVTFLTQDREQVSHRRTVSCHLRHHILKLPDNGITCWANIDRQYLIQYQRTGDLNRNGNPVEQAGFHQSHLAATCASWQAVITRLICSNVMLGNMGRLNTSL